MTALDAPPVERLTLTLEEALAKLGERGYTLAVHHHEDAPEYVLHDAYSAFPRGSFGHWKDAVEAALGVTVVPRDDTAELVEFLERIGAFDENLEAANSPELLPCFNQRLYDEWKQLSIAARAALARVKGGER